METQDTVIDVYELVTNRMIELLEAGTVPWQQPWNGGEPPMNLLSKRPYRGINLLLLLSLNYEQNYFLTWDQIKAVKASVLPGETGKIVVFWKSIKKKPEELDEQGKAKTVPMLRYYKVWNISQCKDIPQELIPVAEAREFDPIFECETIISSMANPPEIRHKEARAYYDPAKDFINMPKQKSFKIPEGYYSTLFHELVHSTGAEKRLGRKTLADMAPFGSESYAMEELIAEMGTAFLCHFAGILNGEINNSAAYITNWLSVLKSDKRFVVLAAGHAQRAADFILGKQLKDSIIETHHPVETNGE